MKKVVFLALLVVSLVFVSIGMASPSKSLIELVEFEQNEAKEMSLEVEGIKDFSESNFYFLHNNGEALDLDLVNMVIPGEIDVAQQEIYGVGVVKRNGVFCSYFLHSDYGNNVNLIKLAAEEQKQRWENLKIDEIDKNDISESLEIGIASTYYCC